MAEEKNLEPSLLETIVDRTIGEVKESKLFTKHQLDTLRTILKKGSAADAQAIAETLRQEAEGDS